MRRRYTPEGDEEVLRRETVFPPAMRIKRTPLTVDLCALLRPAAAKRKSYARLILESAVPCFIKHEPFLGWLEIWFRLVFPKVLRSKRCVETPIPPALLCLHSQVRMTSKERRRRSTGFFQVSDTRATAGGMRISAGT